MRSYEILPRGAADIAVRWGRLTNGEVGQPFETLQYVDNVIGLKGLARLAVTFSGNLGEASTTMRLRGSNDRGTWVDVLATDGDPIECTGGGHFMAKDFPRYVRPEVDTDGPAVSITIELSGYLS
jgi:hypothetical protein